MMLHSPITSGLKTRTATGHQHSCFVSPEIAPEEAAFINHVGALPEQRQWLRFLYAHSREGRNVFMTSDVETFGAAGSERRRHLTNAARTEIVTLAEFERVYVTPAPDTHSGGALRERAAGRAQHCLRHFAPAKWLGLGRVHDSVRRERHSASVRAGHPTPRSSVTSFRNERTSSG
jgi:hypothetical protein